MKLAVEVGSVADGTLAGALQYCRERQIERVVIPFAALDGYREAGSLDLDTLSGMMSQIDDAGLSASTMAYWAPPEMWVGDAGGAEYYRDLVKSLEVMAAAGADVLAMYASVLPPQDVALEETAWQQMAAVYRRLVGEAEARGIRIGLHTVPVRSRNMLWNYAAVRRLFEEVPSSANGLTLCVDSLWKSDGERIYDVVRELGDRLLYLHPQNTSEFLGDTPCWHGASCPDAVRLYEALKDIDYRGDIRCADGKGDTGETLAGLELCLAGVGRVPDPAY